MNNSTAPQYKLPAEAYYEDSWLLQEKLKLFGASWLYAGQANELSEHGSYKTVKIGLDELVIVRDKQGQLNAFHNVCRHRGAQLVQGTGNCGTLVCPYHKWTYGLDGKLLAARSMAEDFDKADHGLNPVALENVGGLIFICLSDNPPPIDRVKADIVDQIAVYDLEKLKVAVQDDYIEDANWKLVMENNRECYHCDVGHPELISVLGTTGFGRDAPADDYLETKRAEWQALGIDHDVIEFPDGWWHRVARLALANGAVTQSIDGKLACQKLIGPFKVPETSSLSVWTQPNSWHHFCCDHVVTFSLTPIGPEKTLLRTSWLVHEDAVEGVDYNPDHLAALWRATNVQDGHFSMVNHQGIANDGYVQGPYAVEENLVEDFKDFYVDRAKAALKAETI
mgnify:CR=1 FL=1